MTQTRNSKSRDIYAFGVILWEIGSRVFPFADREPPAILYQLMQGQREPISEDTPKPIAGLIQRCWDLSPDNRPTSEQALTELRKCLERPKATPKPIRHSEEPPTKSKRAIIRQADKKDPTLWAAPQTVNAGLPKASAKKRGTHSPGTSYGRIRPIEPFNVHTDVPPLVEKHSPLPYPLSKYDLSGCKQSTQEKLCDLVNGRSLSLEVSQGISHNGVRALAEILQMNSRIERIYLGLPPGKGSASSRKVSIGDEGAAVLAEGLKGNTSIRELSLIANGIGDDGAIALAEAFKAHPAQRKIWLGGNSFGPRGARALAEAGEVGSSFTTLDLTQTPIGGKEANALMQALAVNFPATLGLAATGIDAEGLEVLFFKGDATCRVLDLSHNQLGPKGAKALAGALNTADIRRIGFSFNEIGDEGAILLAEALKTNTSLEVIELDSNAITDDGATAIASALEKNSTIRQIQLLDNGISDKGERALAKVLADRKRAKREYPVIYLVKNRCVMPLESWYDGVTKVFKKGGYTPIQN